ncbi:MAG: hypothetical protein ACR2HD_07230 [Solirubrobacteraceae bacterium]|nr:MAG: hypothetical protein DLM63_00425 [Solirubrobacterales bacterium]
MPSVRASTHDLRSAIDCLPVTTRAAMLDGVRANVIIVGAYVDRRGGVCPMLAAHRQGARTDFLPFARAWDGFTRAKRARRASVRELRVLTSHLESSLLAEEEDVDLGEAIAEHRSLAAQTRIEHTRRRLGTRRRAGLDAESSQAVSVRTRFGDPDRSEELRRRPGWSWLRPFRRLDDYEQAIARAEADAGAGSDAAIRAPGRAEPAADRGAEREPAARA